MIFVLKDGRIIRSTVKKARLIVFKDCEPIRIEGFLFWDLEPGEVGIYVADFKEDEVAYISSG